MMHYQMNKKDLVTNLDTLVQKENAYASLVNVNDVISQINALPSVEVVMVTDEAVVLQVVAAYNQLTDAEKLNVTNGDQLVVLQNKIIELKQVLITSITLSAKFITLLEVGDTETSKVTLKPTNATEKVQWTSSDRDVATVVDGIITAVGKGTATITASSQSGIKKAITNVTVAPTVEEAFSSANAYLVSKIVEPKFNGEWNILALARTGYVVPEGYFDKYYQDVVSEVQNVGGVLHKVKYTEYLYDSCVNSNRKRSE